MTVGTDDLERRTYELSIINSIARALNQSVDLQEALQLTLANVTQLLDLETGWIWLLNEETSDAYLAAAQNLPPALARNPARMEGSCYCLDTFRAGDLAGAANVNVVGCSRLWNLVDGTDGCVITPVFLSMPMTSNWACSTWPAKIGANWTRTSYACSTRSAICSALQLSGPSFLTRVDRSVQYLNEIASHAKFMTRSPRVSRPLPYNWRRPRRCWRRAIRPRRCNRPCAAALQLSRSNLDEARRSVMGLRAAPLEGRTLAQALRELVYDHVAVGRAHVDFDAVGGHHPLPLAVEAGLYRVAQEALNNVREHAQAAHVRIDLMIAPPTIELRIEDNGRGFDQRSIERNRYGITGMNERVKLLGGELRVESAPGAGTRVSVVVPFPSS